MTDLENQLHRQWAERHPRPAAAEDPCVVKRARVRSRLRAAGLLTPETSHELFKLTEAELDELLNA